MASPKYLTITVSSPEELKNTIASSAFKGAPLIYLALNDPQVFGRPFLFQDVTVKNLPNYIKSDAMELLSLKPDEIVFDYHVFKMEGNAANGVFACMPKKLLQEYLYILDQSNIYPVVITPYILASINAVFQAFKDYAESFCLLEFGKNNRVDLAIFTPQGCQMLRKIAYDNEDEMMKEIRLSVRSVAAKSKVKEFRQLHVHGDLQGKNALIAKLQSGLGMDLQRDDSVDVEAALPSPKPLFNINLARGFSLSLKEQKSILMAANLVAVALLGLSVVFAAQVSQKWQEYHKVKSQFSAEQLKQAKELQKKLENL